MSENEVIMNPLAQQFYDKAVRSAEKFAGSDVWELMNKKQRTQVIDAVRLVMRMEYAMCGIV